MKQKRLYEEARIDVIQLSSKAQLLAESNTNVSLTSSATMHGYNASVGGFTFTSASGD